MRWAALVALVACHRSTQAPAKQDAAAVKPVDAADAPIDAAPPKKPVPTKVVVGAHASCAVLSDTTVRCWGGNASGQLGDGTTHDSPAPVQPKIRGVKDLVLGDDTACALLDDTSVACWGKIGMGKAPPTLDPIAAPGVKYATRVFAVGGVGCATIGEGGGPKGTPAGAFVCWGDVDERGRFAVAAPRDHRVSTPMLGVSRVVQLSAHGALLEGGDVAYWGDGGSPVRAGITNAVEIASQGDFVCARLDDGSVSCFGAHQPCAAARPAPPPPVNPKPKPKPKGKQKKPAKPAPPPPPPKLEPAKLALPPAAGLAFDAGGVCVVTKAGQMQCLEPGDGCKADGAWLGAVGLASGQCARLADGKVDCWKIDGRARTTAAVPGVIATQLSASGDRGCALGKDGVTCWERGSRPAPVSLP